jgi:hypothetical protein
MGSRSTNRPTSEQPLVSKDARISKNSTSFTRPRRSLLGFGDDQNSSTRRRTMGLKQISSVPLLSEDLYWPKSVPSRKKSRSATTGGLSVRRSPRIQGGSAQSGEDSVTVFTPANRPGQGASLLPVSKGAKQWGLCTSCATIPFSTLFTLLPGESQIRHQLPKISNRKSYCPFCIFVGMVYFQICDGFASQRSWGDIRNRDSPSLVSTSHNKPWYEIAGIKSDLPPAPSAWLQFGSFPGHEHIEPYICVSLSSTPTLAKLRPKISYSLPRERTWAERSCPLDYDLIRSWINICVERHTELCGEGIRFKRRFLDIKLIDVNRRKIVRDDGDLPYAALSYVWGSSLETTSSTSEPELSINDLLPSQLPKTIKDAIVFTRELGLNYLWIDRYCINQRDPVDVEKQISNMDLVYECAELTIVALFGPTIDYGLPGISRQLEHIIQPTLDTDYGTFMATYIESMWDHQGTKAWDKRGWTLQEGILSTRCIFFDKSHIYMRCRQEMFHDAMNVDITPERIITDQSDSYFWENGFSLHIKQKEWDFSVYDALIANYTGRELKVQSDVLGACKGALNQITRNTGVGFIWGMPQIDFCRALLWKAWHGNSISRRNGFPSWSWTGWKGRAEYSYWLDELDAYRYMMEDKWKEHAATLKSAFSWRNQLREIQGEEAFAHTKDLHEGIGGQTLKISSTLIQFNGKVVRKQGRSRRLGPQSQQGRIAIGDQWTLTDSKGRTLENLAGEHMKFESTDHFFQLDPSCSDKLRKDIGKAQLLFIRYWPAIRDHHESENWLFDVVSALVILRIDDRSALRVACVHMNLEDWLAADPQPGVIELI